MQRDPSEEVLGVLRSLFSPPIAKAILSTAMKKVAPGKPLDSESLPALCEALERVLPAYVSDSGRRASCVGELRRIAGDTRPASSPAPSIQPGAQKPGYTTTRINIRTVEDAANAADVGRDVSRHLGFSELDQTKIATVIAELARNILHYAMTGEVAVTSLPGARRGVEVVARDKGPGIANIELVMSTQFKSKTGMGMGLKGSKRIMDSFDLQSKPGEGTTVIVRKFV